MDEVTKEEAARDFSKRSGESREEFFLRVAENLGRHLETSGFVVDPPIQAGTGTVYLKARDKRFEVRITDHFKRGDAAVRPMQRHVLLVKGSSISADDINKLLAEIVARHKK